MKIALVARHVAATTTSTLGSSPRSSTAGPCQADPSAADEATHVLGLGNALAEHGHQVVIYTCAGASALPADQAGAAGPDVRHVPARPARPLTREPQRDDLQRLVGDTGRYLASEWRRHAPDVVHAVHWTSGLAALLAARESAVPVIQAFGSLGADERRAGIEATGQDVRLRMEPTIARAAAGVLASSSAQAAGLARLGVPGTRLRVVPSGVDVSTFTPAGPVAARTGLRRLLHVGSLADHQGLPALVEALAELPCAELVIAGGPASEKLDGDRGYRELSKLAASLGVADRLVFTGHVPDADLPALLRSADVLVSAASYEAFGQVALRAMACGTPVVAPAVGAYADAVIDGTTGVLLPPGQPRVLRRRLRELLGTPMKLTAFGIAAADRANSRYPWGRIGSETLAAYESFLASAPAARRGLGESRRAA